MSGLILIVEDEALLARNLKTFLERRDFEVRIAGTIADGLNIYRELRPDAVLIDYNLPDGNGVGFIAAIRAEDRFAKLVMITAHGTVEIAVEAMKAGADDYLTKPVSLDEVALLLERLLAQSRMEGSLSYYRAQIERRSGADRIVGESPAIRELKQRIALINEAEHRAERAGAPVLILGETGTGKQLVARALHFDGPRREQPFVEINCAALPAQLVESELFGHERGAFTGASDRKAGLFQAADRGTLFLDEIGELPPALQPKLLKAIEEQTIRPVGSTRDRKVDVRLIAATNLSLEDKVRAGEFRGDLFYRLNTVTINSPPLRERGADVLLLARSFLQEFHRRYGRDRLVLGKPAEEALLRHFWPGNVRELRNIMEQATLFAGGETIAVEDLGIRELAPLQAPARPGGSGKKLGDVEQDLIVEALRQHRGNVTLAARKLGISRDTLRYRMEKYAFSRADFI
jgi:DNA-binding NtrC family response regulator